MSVVVVGLHERDAPLELLERLAVSEEELPKALRALCDSPHLAEAVVVSTCLRTEVYAVLERFHDGLADIETFFAARLGSIRAQESLTDRLFVAYDDAAARHLLAVAAGIDSAVLGEGEILRQVRHAAERARHERALGPVLDPLFRQALEAGKRARHETGIARGVTSLAHIAVSAALGALDGDLAGRRVLLLGAGEMASGVVGALGGLDGTPELVIANRSLRRAEQLAETFGGRAVGLEDISDELVEAEVVIGATAGEHPLVRSAQVEQVMRRRAGQRLVIVDAAVPRDVEPEVGALSGVVLFDIDDLRRLAEEAMSSRREEVGSVEVILEEELERWRAHARGRGVAPLVAALRQRGEEVRQEELEQFATRLSNLDEETRALVETFSRRLVARLLHDPTVRLKEVAGSARGERLAEALRGLFDL